MPPTTPPIIGPIELLLLLLVGSTEPVSDSIVLPFVADGAVLPIVLPFESVTVAPPGVLEPLQATEVADDLEPNGTVVLLEILVLPAFPGFPLFPVFPLPPVLPEDPEFDPSVGSCSKPP